MGNVCVICGEVLKWWLIRIWAKASNRCIYFVFYKKSIIFYKNG